MPMAKGKRFWSGYGTSSGPVETFQGEVRYSPAAQSFFNNLGRLLRASLFAAIALALLLPDDLRALLPVVDTWVRQMRRIVPYIAWIDVNSKIPNLASVWFSLVWPLMFLCLGFFITFFPYPVASNMARGMSTTWRHLGAALCGLLLSWMAYGAFYAKFAGVDKTSAIGHGRLIEVFAIDSRMGLAIGGTAVLAACLILWMMTLTVCIALVARLLHRSQR